MVLMLLLPAAGAAQVSSGKITYERKTNLYKKFKGDDVKEWLREEDKNKVDVFELYFNDTMSLFKPQESELRERMSWATDKNTVYQNLKANTRLTLKDLWGEKFYVEDSLWKRTWKITDSKRNIAGYNCRKAIWQPNDSTRIYAWYAEELMTSTGPESFTGLPGTILGMATEDGGVIYFAKTVEVSNQNVTMLTPVRGKNKIYKTAEIKAKLEKDFSKNPWGREMIKNLFGYW
jgi:GLPGLI family protein